MTTSPIRCTQNPTAAEEYRRKWHPEIIAPKTSEDSVLIVGAGPSGLEAAMSLGRRGYRVTVADAADQAGGRVARESGLPGLATWKRVADYRLGQIEKLSNVDIYLQSELDKDQVLAFALELNIQHVLCATGSRWDVHGIGRQHRSPVPVDRSIRVITPEDIMDGAEITGKAVVYDDDHYYMGGVIAEALINSGAEVTLVTPAADVSIWTHNTLEQGYIEKHLNQLGVRIIEKFKLDSLKNNQVFIAHTSSGKLATLEAETLVMVTARRPGDKLYFELDAEPDLLKAAGIQSVNRAGDCVAPSTIAAAVYAGHLFARDFGEQIDVDKVPYIREHLEI